MGSSRFMTRYNRRRFLRALGSGAALTGAELFLPRALGVESDPILAGRPLVRYPEKTDLILLTSRPPQLETPMRYFERAITPDSSAIESSAFTIELQAKGEARLSDFEPTGRIQ